MAHSQHTILQPPQNSPPGTGPTGLAQGEISGGPTLHHQQSHIANKGTNGIQCWQLNLHHCQSASYNLTRELDKHSGKISNIALLQEPWQVRGCIKGLPGRMKLFSFGDPSGPPRACVLLSSELSAWGLPHLSNRDLVAVRLEGLYHKGQRKTIVVASIYMPHEDTAPPLKVTELVSYCEQQGLPLIVGTDANSHHEAWGSTGTNIRGEQLLTFLISTNLAWNNMGHKPTFQTKSRKEVLDLTLNNGLAEGLVEGWHISDIPSLSDHAIIRFRVSEGTTHGVLKRNIRNTDWKAYSSSLNATLLGQALPQIQDTDQLDKTADLLTKCIKRTWEDTCPLRWVPTNRSYTWWTSELAQERKMVRRLHRVAKGTGHEANWDAYRHALHSFKSNIRKTKRRKWWEYCQEINSTGEVAKVGKLLKADPRHQLGSIESPNGHYTTNSEDTLEVMLSAHLSEGRRSGGVEHDHTPRPDLAHTVVTERGLRAAVFRSEPYKAPGVDGIYPAMLHQGWTSLKPWLWECFRASITLGYIPKCWQQARGVFTPKPGKDSYTKAKSFRLITLTSFLLKTLERLVLWYLQGKEQIETKLHPKQFGFRRGCSTEAALHQLVSKIEKSIVNGNFALGIFLDIEGAFDNVSFASIEEATSNKGISVGVSRWISHMLRNRTLEVELGSARIRREITKGCPQGGDLVPSPLEPGHR